MIVPKKLSLLALLPLSIVAAAPAAAQDLPESSHDEGAPPADVPLPDASEQSHVSEEAADAPAEGEFSMPDVFGSLDGHQTDSVYADVKDFAYKPFVVIGISDFYIIRSDLAQNLPHGAVSIFGNVNYGPRVSNETMSVLRGAKYAIVFVCNHATRLEQIPISADAAVQQVNLQCN